MNRLIVFVYWLCLWGITSCASSQVTRKGAPTQNEVEDFIDSNLGRIAAVDYQYADSTRCTAAATAYFDKQGGKGPPIPISRNPLIYSFCAGCVTSNNANAQEIRFLVRTARAGEPAETAIKFWEIDRKLILTRGMSIKKIYNKLNKIGFEGIEPPEKDDVEVNDRKPWRATVKSTEKSGVPRKFGTEDKAQKEFGIIINPPYP